MRSYRPDVGFLLRDPPVATMPFTGKDDSQIWTCDRCETTVTCSLAELLNSWKWFRKTGPTKKPWELVLCDECKPSGT